jgi:hypothetical protein
MYNIDNIDNMSDIDSIPTPYSYVPSGYKLVIHKYYTEILPIEINIPQTPVKKNRNFIYTDDSKKYKSKLMIK